MTFKPFVKPSWQPWRLQHWPLGLMQQTHLDWMTPTLGLLSAGAILALRALGGLQGWELSLFDQFMRLRPSEPIDPRVVLVEITEQDIAALGSATLSDQRLADLLAIINQANPAVVGLDLYRNVPVGEGHAALNQVFAQTPNLIGIEKVVHDSALAAIAGNEVLVEQDRSAASDLIVDVDAKVRRGFVFPSADGDRVIESLGYRVAYEYLVRQGLQPERDSRILTIDGVKFWPVESSSGGYVRADSGGYQLLLNWRRASPQFQAVSATEVFSGRVRPDVFTDRIVMLGSTQSGSGDIFFTAYGHQGQSHLLTAHGLEIHANIASSIVSAVLDGRPLIKTLPAWIEGLLIIGAAKMGLWIYFAGRTDLRRLGLVCCTVGGSVLASYGLLLPGWWVPLLPTSLALVTTPLVMRLQKINQLQSLSAIDDLTQLTNRRVFKEQLQQEWARGVRSRQPLSLIICDVDYFKLYNDTYGHLQGDECLRQVAKALQQTIHRPGDLVARYGGEEFVFLLPNTEADGALALAQTARSRIEALKLPHVASQVSDYVTVSMGITSVVPDENISISTIVDTADLGLYEAKRKGRNQTVLRLPWSF